MFNREIINQPIYLTAFTHRSYLNETPQKLESNERLEFLGDAVLSFVISSHLYRLRPQDSEGDLTNLRSFIVKTDSLAKAATNLQLGEYLKLSTGEELSGGRRNVQILANTFEALLGAIFFDQGLPAAEQFVEDNLLPLFTEELKNGPPKDSKSQLQELSQNRYKQSPRYKVLQTRGPDHAKRFKVGVFVDGNQLGAGEGLSKQIAEEAAARQALEVLQEVDNK